MGQVPGGEKRRKWRGTLVRSGLLDEMRGRDGRDMFGDVHLILDLGGGTHQWPWAALMSGYLFWRRDFETGLPEHLLRREKVHREDIIRSREKCCDRPVGDGLLVYGTAQAIPRGTLVALRSCSNPGQPRPKASLTSLFHLLCHLFPLTT